jgi:hypothetical protein
VLLQLQLQLSSMQLAQLKLLYQQTCSPLQGLAQQAYQVVLQDKLTAASAAAAVAAARSHCQQQQQQFGQGLLQLSESCELWAQQPAH